MSSGQVWLMVAFEAAPGYKPAKSGKSWWATFSTREAAIAAKLKLVAAGTGFVCKKVDDTRQAQRRPRRAYSSEGGRVSNVLDFKERAAALDDRVRRELERQEEKRTETESRKRAQRAPAAASGRS